MEPADVYGKIDMWPPEPERATLMHLASEVPLLQNTLMRIFIIGLSKVRSQCQESGNREKLSGQRS